MDVDVDIDFDEDDILEAFEDQIREAFRQKIETDMQDGTFECDCGSQWFDIETWTDNRGNIKAAGVCRECNENLSIDVEIDGL